MKIPLNIYKEILHNLYDGVYILDKNRKIIYWNKGAEKITGYSEREVLGRRCSDDILMHIDKKGVKLCGTDDCPAVRTIENGEVPEEELYIHHREGYRIPVLTRIDPVRDSKGKLIGTAEIFSDNSHRVSTHERIEELQKLALLDSLTELGNRRYIETNLRVRINEMKRYQWPFGLIFIDIDHFKRINDAHGHDVGDRVLKTVSHTLSNNSRPFDIFGRWGGEEFVGIIVNVDKDELRYIAERLRLLVSQSTLSEGSHVLRVTVSIGATIALENDSSHSIMKRADRLMYKSKAAGLNCVTLD
ncbi:MAG: sensor domain-containing diguanylate cyclase [Candidatus Omnitrophota bacterium]